MRSPLISGLVSSLAISSNLLAQAPDSSRQGTAAYGGSILPSQERRVIVPILPYRTIDLISNELSGELPLQHIQQLSLYHRTGPSLGYKKAADYVLGKLRDYGVTKAEEESFPADGKVIYSTLKSRPQWDAEFAELSELEPTEQRVASYEETALAIARYSKSADITSDVVDVGLGINDADYLGKDVAGKIVLADGDVNTVHRKAVYEHGAAGVIDYHLNLIPTARQQDLLDIVTQGMIWPLDPEYERKATFAFVVSPRMGRELRALIHEGKKIRVHAQVNTRVGPGEYQVVTALIPGEQIPNEEFVLSCHLSHPRPGAVDNASGCAVILEIARSLTRLIGERLLPRPRRSIRFMFPPENAGTVIYEVTHPELKKHQVGAVQLDGVGSNPMITGAILHLYRTPYSMATYLNDVAQNLFQFVSDTNIEKIPYRVSFPHQFEPRIIAPYGSRDNFWGSVDEFFDGSDSFIYSDSSIGVPAVYLEDWPDPYLHSNADRIDHVDATKLRRSAVIAALIAYAVASGTDNDVIRFASETGQRARERIASLERESFDRLYLCNADQMTRCYGDGKNAIEQAYKREAAAIISPLRLAVDNSSQNTLNDIRRDFLTEEPKSLERLKSFYSWRAGLEHLSANEPEFHENEKVASTVFPKRNMALIGPMDSFFFDYLTLKVDPNYRQHYEIFNLPVNSYAFETAYETLNFADGSRSVLEIARALQAEFGKVPLDAVDQYIRLLASVGVIEMHSSPTEQTIH